jgi:hypothetical protein
MMNDIRPVRLRLLLLLPLLGLAACEAPTGCDPARAGFLERLGRVLEGGSGALASV